MKISREIYYLRTANSPIMFHYGHGEETDLFEEAEFYPTLHDAEEELKKFDEPGEWLIGPATVSAVF